MQSCRTPTRAPAHVGLPRPRQTVLTRAAPRRRRWRGPPAPPRAQADDDPRERQQQLRDQAQALERLFAAAAEPVPSPPPAPPQALLDVPLWRVQWVCLPGTSGVLHVHVPHYTSMFVRLLSGPQPWRFGHLQLPGGSASLGDPAFSLADLGSTRAPVVGCLQEVLQSVRFPDGRMLLLVAGVGRFRVLRETQAVPHGRADVVLIEDADMPPPPGLEPEPELEDESDEARARRRLVGDAARAAAARAWWDWELSAARVVPAAAAVDGEDEAAAMAFGRRLLEVANGAEVVPLPAAVPGAAAPPGPGGSEGGEAAGAAAGAEAAAEAAAAAEAVVADAALAAREAAAGAAAAVDAAAAAGPEGAALLDALRRAPPPSAAEALLPGDAADSGADEDPADALPPSAASAAALEARLWVEIDAVGALAERLRGRRAPLPPGLLGLRPGVAPAGYPAARRAQRLSHATAALLPELTHDARQALLEAGSTTLRLRMVLARLRKHRAVLGALIALNDVKEQP